MRNFEEYLNEYKLLGKLKPYEKLLYNTYIDFINNYFNVNIKVEISFRKPSGKLYFGYIDLIGLSNGKYKIIVEHTLSDILAKIGHEFTHLVQYKNGKLGFTEDHKTVTWNGVDYITVKDLGKITKLHEYKKLPWEEEAYEVQAKIVKEFMKSSHFKEIEGKDPNIDFLISNNALS